MADCRRSSLALPSGGEFQEKVLTCFWAQAGMRSRSAGTLRWALLLNRRSDRGEGAFWRAARSRQAADKTPAVSSCRGGHGAAPHNPAADARESCEQRAGSERADCGRRMQQGWRPTGGAGPVHSSYSLLQLGPSSLVLLSLNLSSTSGVPDARDPRACARTPPTACWLPSRNSAVDEAALQQRRKR